jgi:hypothetical protein
MIVVEDIEANEIGRFIVVDASLQLGIVRAGTYIRTFDPDRAYSFYSRVENQLHDFAASYPGAFKYLPRRAYDYLKRPRLLNDLTQGASELSQSSWLVDFMIAKPLIDLGGTMLPPAQQKANTESVYRWATNPPTSPRIYHLQDMRYNRRTPTGWGCNLRAADLAQSLKGANRRDLLSHIKSERPIFIELQSPDCLDSLVEWLVLLKEAGLKSPRVVLKARSQKDWRKDITRLLDIPESSLLTAGASISSLSTAIRYLKKEQNDEQWSRRLMFASSYPETQLGDSISEIISYFLSRNLSATSEDIQRILGGNLLSILPPRPPFAVYSGNETSVIAEESLGKAAMNELVRILQLLDAKKILRIVSVDYMVRDNGGSINLDSAVLTLTEPYSEKATSISLILEKNGAVMVSGWKKAFSESMTKRDSMLLETLVRANARLDGPVYGSPAHLVLFDDALLNCLQIENRKEIVSSLHFGVQIAKTEPGIFLMAPTDMEILNLVDENHVLALGTRTGRWSVGRVKEHARYSERAIVISETDAELYGFTNSSVVNIVKFEGEIMNIQKLVISFCTDKPASNSELLSIVHLHEDTLFKKIQNRLVGINSKLFLEIGGFPLSLSIIQTTPTLALEQMGVIPEANIHLQASQIFREFNVLICVSRSREMNKRDVTLKTLSTVCHQLEPLSKQVPELKKFLGNLTPQASRSEIAALCVLLLVNNLRHNQTEGRLGFVTFSDAPEKFSIQHGGEIQPYIEFLSDMQSEEVYVSLVYSILDSIGESSGEENMAGAYRAVAEYLEDFGSALPTLVLLFSGDIGKFDEDHLPFLQAIKERERYQIEFLKMGKNSSHRSSLRILKGINARILPLEVFSSQVFLGHILDVIDSIVPACSTSDTDV